MLKKILVITLLVGFVGVLVWGGVNRTFAKTSEKSVEEDGPVYGNGFGREQSLDYEDDCGSYAPEDQTRGNVDPDHEDDFRGDGFSAGRGQGNGAGRRQGQSGQYQLIYFHRLQRIA